MTFGAIKQRVSDEMKRGELSVSSTAVQQSVIDAIRYFETRRTWFNEAVDATITTTPDAATLSSIPTGIVKIDSFTLSINSNKYALEVMDYKTMDTMDTGQWSGYPEYYTFYADKIRLYPPPNATYTATISFIKRLDEVTISATANASNAWVVEAESVIRKRAKGELFQNELRNYQEAKYWFEQAELEFRTLTRQNVGRRSGYIVATKF